MMVNFVHVTKPEKKMFFCLLTCVERRRNLESPYRKVLGKLFTITITDVHKSGSIKPMKLRFCYVEKYWGQLQVKRSEKVQSVLYT